VSPVELRQVATGIIERSTAEQGIARHWENEAGLALIDSMVAATLGGPGNESSGPRSAARTALVVDPSVCTPAAVAQHGGRDDSPPSGGEQPRRSQDVTRTSAADGTRAVGLLASAGSKAVSSHAPA